MEKVNYIIEMVNYDLKGNIYKVLDWKERNILKEDLNLMENIYLIENGMEKAMMKKVI